MEESGHVALYRLQAARPVLNPARCVQLPADRNIYAEISGTIGRQILAILPPKDRKLAQPASTSRG